MFHHPVVKNISKIGKMLKFVELDFTPSLPFYRQKKKLLKYVTNFQQNSNLLSNTIRRFPIQNTNISVISKNSLTPFSARLASDRTPASDSAATGTSAAASPLDYRPISG